MNVFWKTILGTVVTIAAIVAARYSSNWIANHTYRADRMTQAERVRLQNEAVDRVIQRSYAQARQRQNSTPPHRPPPFYTPPHRPPNYASRPYSNTRY